MAPAYLGINDYIMDKISTGEWPVGHMIPTEMQLCEQFGVSRPTVRTAVLKLVQEGHLRRVKGKGTFVTAPRVLEQSTVFIESFLREMRQRGIEISTEVLEFRIMSAEPEIMEKLESDGKEMIKLSRLRYVKDSFDQGPIVLTTSWFTGKEKYLLKYEFERRSLTEVFEENGRRRKYMEKALTAVPLGVRESRLLGVHEGDLAMRITSVCRDQDGRLMEYCESLYPLERNQFVLKLQL